MISPFIEISKKVFAHQRRSQNVLRFVAGHEIAHAIVGIQSRLPVDYLRILPRLAGGECVFNGYPKSRIAAVRAWLAGMVHDVMLYNTRTFSTYVTPKTFQDVKDLFYMTSRQYTSTGCDWNVVEKLLRRVGVGILEREKKVVVKAWNQVYDTLIAEQFHLLRLVKELEHGWRLSREMKCRGAVVLPGKEIRRVLRGRI